MQRNLLKNVHAFAMALDGVSFGEISSRFIEFVLCLSLNIFANINQFVCIVKLQGNDITFVSVYIHVFRPCNPVFRYFQLQFLFQINVKLESRFLNLDLLFSSLVRLRGRDRMNKSCLVSLDLLFFLQIPYHESEKANCSRLLAISFLFWANRIFKKRINWWIMSHGALLKLINYYYPPY